MRRYYVLFVICLWGVAPLSGYADQKLPSTEVVVPKVQRHQVPPQARAFFPLPPMPKLRHKRVFAYPWPSFSPPSSTLGSYVRLRKAVLDPRPPLHPYYVQVGGDLYNEKLQATLLLNQRFYDRYNCNFYAEVDGIRKLTLEGYGDLALLQGKPSIAFRYRRRSYTMPVSPDQARETQAFNYTRGIVRWEDAHWGRVLYTLVARYSFLQNDSRNRSYWGLLREGQLSLAGKTQLVDLGRGWQGTITTDFYLGHHQNAFSTSQQARILWRIKPKAHYTWHGWEGTVGLQLHAHNDTAHGLGLRPDFRLCYNKLALHPYVRLMGDCQPQGLQQVVNDNCWITQERPLKLRHTQETIAIEGGLQYSPLPLYFVTAGVRYSKYRDMLFFVPKNSLFTLRYDHPFVFHPFAMVQATNAQKTLTGRLQLKGWWYHHLSHLKVPHHRPRYALELMGIYHLYDKVRLHGTVQWLGGVSATERVKLPALLDASFGIDYFLMHHFMIYTQVTNFLARTNAHYQNQPGKPFEITFGLSYAW